MRKDDVKSIDASPPKYISIGDAIARYDIGRTTLHALIAANQVQARKLGARTLIDREAADRFFESLPSASKTRTRFK